jgi:AcrR family transcriptional regulator
MLWSEKRATTIVVRRQQKRHVQGEAEETRQMIMRVAYEFFMQYGYRAVTTRQLAEACGLTQPALYHYFSEKQDLYLAVVTEEIAKIKAALERLARRSEEVEVQLRQIASFLLSRNQYDLSLMLHDVRYELSADARALLDEQFRQGFILPLAALFEQGIRQGSLRPVEEGGLAPISAAYLFMTMLSAFRQEPQKHATPSGSAAHGAIADLVVRLLLHGLSAPERP